MKRFIVALLVTAVIAGAGAMALLTVMNARASGPTVPDVSTMERVRTVVFGCTVPFIPEMYKTQYRASDGSSVLVLGAVDQENEKNPLGPGAIFVTLDKDDNQTGAFVRINGKVEAMSFAGLLERYPTPCDIYPEIVPGKRV